MFLYRVMHKQRAYRSMRKEEIFHKMKWKTLVKKMKKGVHGSRFELINKAAEFATNFVQQLHLFSYNKRQWF